MKPSTVFLLFLGIFLPLGVAGVNLIKEQERHHDHFNTTKCYCHEMMDPAGLAPVQYRSGSWFGMSYWNRHLNKTYPLVKIKSHHAVVGSVWESKLTNLRQPRLNRHCHTYEDGAKLCYWRHPAQESARYSYRGKTRKMTPMADSEHLAHKAVEVCRDICRNEIGLANVTEHLSQTMAYKHEGICPHKWHGHCT